MLINGKPDIGCSTLTPRMSTLHDILWNMTIEHLANRARLLAANVKCTRKAEYIDAIKRGCEGDGLRALWHSLKEVERLAVAEACYASLHHHDAARFEAKYGQRALFYDLPDLAPGGYRSSQDEGKYATRLNLLLYPDPEHPGYCVPRDLAQRLTSFVPEPPAAAVSTLSEPQQEPGLFLRHTEQAALTEVKTLLRLADQGMLKFSTTTGMPSAAGTAKIIEHLTNGDWFPPEVACVPGLPKYDQQVGNIKPVGWTLLLHTARLIDMAGTKSRLASAGAKMLGMPPHEAIRTIWMKWLDNRTHDEFNRIGPIKGQTGKGAMTAKQPRRHAIIEALASCPANEWILTGEFSRYMQAAGHEFEVTHDPWKLYICERQYGSLGYSGFHEWNILQFRYILCFLFEYAATLGLIDIAYVHPEDGLHDFGNLWGADGLRWLSRYDGLRAFRITNLGAFCLGLSETFTPCKAGSSVKLSVLPNLAIQAVAGELGPDEVLMIETWAEPLGGNIWRLNPERALDAIERGRCVREFASFLQERDEQPLPETVEAFCKASESNGTAVRCTGEAVLFECRDAAAATMLCQQKELDHLIYRAGETVVAVPSAHVQRFRKCARSLGFGVV